MKPLWIYFRMTLAMIAWLKNLINYSLTFASLKRNCLRSVNFSSSSVDSRTTYEVISCVFTVLFTESSTDIFILKRKWRWVKKVVYFDCRRKRKRQALFLRYDLNQDKAGYYQFQMTNFSIDKRPRAKAVD